MAWARSNISTCVLHAPWASPGFRVFRSPPGRAPSNLKTLANAAQTRLVVGKGECSFRASDGKAWVQPFRADVRRPASFLASDSVSPSNTITEEARGTSSQGAPGARAVLCLASNASTRPHVAQCSGDAAQQSNNRCTPPPQLEVQSSAPVDGVVDGRSNGFASP